MFGKTIGFFQMGFTLIELPIAIAIIGVISVGTSQFVELNAVRITPSMPNVASNERDCSATLTILDQTGTMLKQTTVAMGDGSVHNIQWSPVPSENTAPTQVYAIISKPEPALGLPAPCARNGEIFATMEVKNSNGQTMVLLPAVQLPAVQ